MTTSTQLYANNAKSTLLSSIIAGDVTLTVAAGEGAKFPNPGAGQYFLATIEVGTSNEIVQVTARSTDTFTIVRGQEATTAAGWAAGSLIEMRVTRDTLGRFARLQDRVTEVNSVDNLTTPITSDANSYLCHSNDDGGCPILAIRDTNTNWRFVNHSTAILTASSTSTGSTTTLTSTSISTLLATVVAGKYIVAFTSGALAGLARMITSSASNQVTWATATASAPQIGDTFVIYQSDFSYFNSGDTELAPVPLTSASGVITVPQGSGTHSFTIAGSEAITSITSAPVFASTRRWQVLFRWTTARTITAGANLILVGAAASRTTAIGDMGFYELTSAAGVVTAREIVYSVGGGGSSSGATGLFNTSVNTGTSLAVGTASTTVFTSAVAKDLVWSIQATNLNPGITRKIFASESAQGYYAFGVPIPPGTAVELLKKPKIMSNTETLALSSDAQFSISSITQTSGLAVVTTSSGHGLLDQQYVAISGANQAGYNIVARATTRFQPSGITRVTTTATCTIANHGLANGQTVSIIGAVQAQYNGSFTIANVTTNTFDYTMGSDPGATATGNFWATFLHVFKYNVASGTTSPATGTVIGTDVVATIAVQDSTNANYIGAGATVPWTTLSVSSLTSATSVTQRIATCTTGSNHNLETGDTVLIIGATQYEYVGFQTVQVTGATTFTYDVAPAATTPATGTITCYVCNSYDLYTNASTFLTEGLLLTNITGPTVGAALTQTITNANLTTSGTTATCVCSAVHGAKTGDLITISGSTVTNYNGTFVVTVTNTTTFTYPVLTGTTSPSTGSPVMSHNPEVADVIGVWWTDTNNFIKGTLAQNVQVPINSTIELLEYGSAKRMAATDKIRVRVRKGGQIAASFSGSL